MSASQIAQERRGRQEAAGFAAHSRAGDYGPMRTPGEAGMVQRPSVTMSANLARVPMSEIRVRPALAPQSAAVPEIAERGGDRGGGARPARRHRHCLVPVAFGWRTPLFHR